MNKIIAFLFFFFSLNPRGHAQISPREGSQLNYRLVGFSFSQLSGTGLFNIEISAGYYNSVDSFKKNIIKSAYSKRNKVIIEVPRFDAQYTWRVTYSGAKKNDNILHHFKTNMDARVDTGKLRLRILHKAEAYKDAYLAVDGGGVLYDMSGQPVWYIPEKNGVSGYVADLQFTARGTVTFICGKVCCEMNYNGDIVWQARNTGAVNGDTEHGEVYHHELTLLPNGHFMVLGQERLMCRSISNGDSSYILISNNKTEQPGYKQGRFGNLIEYDEKGNVVWTWKSVDYLLKADLAYFKPTDSNIRFDPHDNAFYFDEKQSCIYLGFRNLNRIIKIDYPSGKVTGTYGATYKAGAHAPGEGLFCNQHNIARSQDGYLYFFNNNSCMRTDSMPSVIMIQEPATAKGPVKKVWEYVCVLKEDTTKRFGSGGNAIELPDRSMFLCMGSGYSKLLIVNHEKKELWSAIPERYLNTDEKWVPNHQYRANIISRKTLERMVWAAEK